MELPDKYDFLISKFVYGALERHQIVRRAQKQRISIARVMQKDSGFRKIRFADANTVEDGDDDENQCP